MWQIEKTGRRRGFWDFWASYSRRGSFRPATYTELKPNIHGTSGFMSWELGPRFFYFYIFYFRFLQKYIFDLEIYRNIPRQTHPFRYGYEVSAIDQPLS